MVLNQTNGNSATILVNEIDSITFEDTRQLLWSKDSLYDLPISSLNNTSFERLDLPDVLVKTEEIGEWSELRIAKDGSLLMEKKAFGKELNIQCSGSLREFYITLWKTDISIQLVKKY